MVEDRDAVFFVSTDHETQDVFLDCVFVIAEVCTIQEAESRFSVNHPARHYHFDHERSPSHINSKLTRVADPELSFIPNPPMPLAAWVEDHVAPRTMPALDYFRLTKRRNVRVVVFNAQGIYDRAVEWARQPAHAALNVLPLRALQQVQPAFPGVHPIDWQHA